MYLYHYAPKESNVLKNGILSLSKLPQELIKYNKRAGSNKPEKIIRWLEQTFPGRTQAISVLTEPVIWEGNDPMLKEWVKTKQLLKINFTKLLKDELIKSIWCKECSNAGGFNEKIYPINSKQIDLTSLPWGKCSKEKGLFFGIIRHYLLVMKDGYIPPKYFTIIK